MHRLAHLIVSTKGERQVAYAATGLREGQILLDPLNGPDEVDAVCLVLLNARSHGENIDIEDNVLRREPDICQ